MRVQIAASTLILALASTTLVRPASAQVQPTAPTAGDQGDNPAGHGSISIAYFDTEVNGFWLRSNVKLPFGVIRRQGAGFDASYNLSNDWTVYGGIRYFSSRYEGTLLVNCPTTAPPQCANQPPLVPPHPESQFVDDGNSHGTWQDWNLGVAYHANVGNYFITPSVTAFVPSHDYPTFGNAIAGQDLRQLLLAATASHQFDFTNFYYKLGYGYAFSQHVLGIDTGYQRFDAELGWFINERFSVRGFLTGRAGFGARSGLGPPPNPRNIHWFEKERTTQHDYHAAGFGFDYDFGNRYVASANVQHEFWGDSSDDFKYSLEVRLTRSF